MTSTASQPAPKRRRRLLCRGAAAASAVLLAACGSGGSTGNSATSSGVPTPVTTFGVAAGPVPEIKWNLPYGEPNTIDPPNTAYYSSALVAMNVCEPLLRLNPDYSIASNLATLSQPDPLRLVLKLTAGVTFSDGSPMTAQDVVWSLDHARNPATLTSFLFANVAGVTGNGDQVTIRLKAPDSLLGTELATFAGAIQQRAFSVRAGKELGNAQTGVMCTGPFTLGSWTPGQSITLARNAGYWNPSRAAKAQKVTLSFTADSTSMAQALVSGEIDGAYEVPAATIPKLRSAGSGHLVFGSPTQLYLALSALQKTGALAANDVRRALFMTIDRAALAKVVYQGAATANYTTVNKDSWDNASTPAAARQVWQQAYDGFVKERGGWGSAASIAQAKSLAAAAGYHGEPIVLATLAGDATLNQVAQLIQATAKQAGLNVQIKPLQSIDYSNVTVDAKGRAGLDLLLSVSFNGAPTALEPMLFDYLPDSFYNYTGYSDATVTAAIAAARAATDPQTQASKLVAAQAVYEQAYTSSALVQLNEIAFLNNRLSGLTASFAYLNQASLATIGAAE